MAAGQVSVSSAGSGLLLCLLWLGSVQAGKLLVIPADSSHWMGMKPLVEELGRRGNQVVVVMPEASLRMPRPEYCTTLTFPVPYTNAQVQGMQGANLERVMNTDVSNPLVKLVSYFITLNMLSKNMMKTCDSLLYNKELLQTLRDYDFDAILTDPFDPPGLIVGEYLSLPSISLMGGMPCGVDAMAAQCPRPSSYVPRFYTHYTDHMTLLERTENFVRAMLVPLACNFQYSNVDEIASRFLQRKTSMVEMMSRTSVFLMRYDFTFEYPMPVMPNMVMIGGMSCEKHKPLPLVSLK